MKSKSDPICTFLKIIRAFGSISINQLLFANSKLPVLSPSGPEQILVL